MLSTNDLSTGFKIEDDDKEDLENKKAKLLFMAEIQKDLTLYFLASRRETI